MTVQHHPYPLVLIVLLVLLKTEGSIGFLLPTSRLPTQSTRLQSSTSDKVERLLELVLDPKNNDPAIRQSVSELRDEESLESATNSDLSLFTPLLGNYNVSCSLPSEPSEKPVGGKWNNGIFSIQQTWQHLVPALKPQSVAQAVNVIVLKAFFWRIHVILRGDAYAIDQDERVQIAAKRNTPGGLSLRTVRADFDPPRIVFSNKAKRVLLCLSLGPPSSVILDTPFCDDRVRIGKGSKGSQFVFVRSDDPVADEWKELVNIKVVSKRQLLALFGIIAATSLSTSWRLSGIGRWMTLFVGAASLISTIAIASSTGGIETDRHTDINELKEKKPTLS
jgi:hypothetical protein